MRAVTLPPTLRPSDPDYSRERYGPAEAALYLAISKDALYDAVHARAIGHRRLRPGRGGKIFFSQADLDAWRASQRIEAEGPATGRAHVAKTSRGVDLQQLMPRQRAFG